ncbi:MAG: phage tail protein [Pseudomonadota bacterium]
MSNAPSPSSQQLYSLLPGVYRERDAATTAPDRHLRTYLAAHGMLLDMVRNTVEQMYADHFPDVPNEGRVCQSWVIPYLADLVGAVPVSPFADGQREEVANAVRWSKAKGTLAAVEEIIETIAQSEAELQEGWARVARTARIDEPVLPALYHGADEVHPVDQVHADADQTASFFHINPQVAASHPGLPAVSLDFRKHSRAVSAAPGSPGSQETLFGPPRSNWPRGENTPASKPGEPASWRQMFPNAAPCMPGSYQDVSRRTVDLRTPDPAGHSGRHHPKRLIAYLPPPSGLCPAQAEAFPLPLIWSPADANGHEHAMRDGEVVMQDDKPVLRRISDNAGQTISNLSAGSVLLLGDLNVDEAGKRTTLERIRIDKVEEGEGDGAIRLSAGRLELKQCAVRAIEIGAAPDDPADQPDLCAEDCLFSVFAGGPGVAKLVYCTILELYQANMKVNASEVIFPDNTRLESLACVRFSRLPRAAFEGEGGERRKFTNTSDVPLFISSDFCTPGCGILLPESSTALLNGAEDGTEIGAFHAWRFSAQRQAVRDKLADFLPPGLEPVLVWDPTMLCEPPAVKDANP